MEIHVYTACWNEEAMLPYFFRHYEQFATKIFVYDNQSTDKSPELIQNHPLAELRSHKHEKGQGLEDALLKMKTEEWKGSRGADWVIICDVDELIYNRSIIPWLGYCSAKGITVPKTVGYNMLANQFPTTDGQIYEEVQMGCRDGMLDKLLVFDPNKIDHMFYKYGCHTAMPTGWVQFGELAQLSMLHFKWMGLDYVRQRYADLNDRRSEVEKKRNIAGHYAAKERDLIHIFNEQCKKSVRVPCFFDEKIAIE